MNMKMNMKRRTKMKMKRSANLKIKSGSEIKNIMEMIYVEV